MKSRYIIGIDEAGRGPLAGPVSVCAFGVKNRSILRKFRGIKDSKQLSEKQREEWFGKIREYARDGLVHYKVGMAKSHLIDSKGISHAIYSVLNRCIRRLEEVDPEFKNAEILLDGSLYASGRYRKQKTIIGGDESVPIIALASVCAKVTRDRKMKVIARDYPGYGLEIHKGYGTKMHYTAIRKLGISPVHRKSFLGKIIS